MDNLQNSVIIAVLVIIVFLSIRSSVKHFKGEGGCCGGSSAKPKKKKLKNIIKTKCFYIDGMSCEKCKNRVEEYLNSIDGIAANVKLRRKCASVSMDREVDDAVISDMIGKAGYTVTDIK